MNWLYSQNDEEKVISDYFRNFKGTLLDIGANDGHTFSNSYDLISQGWNAVLFEPGSVYSELEKLHSGNDKVKVYNLGIGSTHGSLVFWESGSHVKNGRDTGLVSTTKYYEMIKWKRSGVKFTETTIKIIPFSWITEKHPKFDFISIDCEGMDWEVLQQIDLKKVKCKCLCIEWNSNKKTLDLYNSYCHKFGMKEIHRNAENVIYAI